MASCKRHLCAAAPVAATAVASAAAKGLVSFLDLLPSPAHQLMQPEPLMFQHSIVVFS
jgi:hypothetical protein